MTKGMMDEAGVSAYLVAHEERLRLEHYRQMQGVLYKAIRVAVVCSGSLSLCKEVARRVNKVHEAWERRWPSGGGYPSVRALADEMKIWVDSYVEIFNELPSLANVANDGARATLAQVDAHFKDADERQRKFKGEVVAGATKGAKEGVIEYNERVLLRGEDVTRKRKRGGGSKAGFDVEYLQCEALMSLGQEVKDGKRSAPVYRSGYADMVIRKSFHSSDNPFVYEQGMSGREMNGKRTKLLHRFATYCSWQGVDWRDALPLACPASE